MLSPPPPFCCPHLRSLLEVAAPRLHPHQLHHPRRCWDPTWSSCNTPVSSMTSTCLMCIRSCTSVITSVNTSTEQHRVCHAMHTQFKQHHKQACTRCLLTAEELWDLLTLSQTKLAHIVTWFATKNSSMQSNVQKIFFMQSMFPYVPVDSGAKGAGLIQAEARGEQGSLMQQQH